MSRNATASWSGYSHQGKVGLLIALRKIKALNLDPLTGYTLELETQEDAKLMHGIDPIEVHQVKAKVGDAYISSYIPAIKKFEGCNGLNYLHTICEITNWNTLAQADNPAGVDRYPYTATRNFCPLAEIDQFILAEISAVLELYGHSECQNVGWCQGGFNEFLAVLDEKIRIEHATKAQADYQIVFTLDDLFNIITQIPTKYKSIVSAIRREIYEQYLFFINALEDQAFPSMTVDHEAFVISIIQQICLLDDQELENFLYQIFPSTTNGKKLSTCALTDDFFSSKAFTSTFLYTLILIDRQRLILEGGTYPHYKLNLNYLLSAIQETDVLKKVAARNILNNDKLNTVRYEADFIINESLSGKLSEIAGRVIPQTEGSLFAIRDITLITREDVINKINI